MTEAGQPPSPREESAGLVAGYPPALGRLLVVDDEAELMAALRDMLTQQGYEVVGVSSGEEGLGALREQPFDLVLTDLMMPGMGGIAVLREAQTIDPYVVGIVMTGQGTVESAVEAMKAGAFDYLLKPFKLREVLRVLSRAMEVHRLRMENLQLRDTMAIYELSQAVAFRLEPKTLIGKVADAALEQCRADEVSVMLETGDGGGLYVAVARGAGRDQLLGERVRVGEGVAGWVARHREPVTLHGRVEDGRFAPLHPRPEIRAAVSMPMVSGEKLIGVLNVNLTRGRHRFTLGQIKALSILTSTAASALENVRLHAEVLEAEARYRSIFENSLVGLFRSTREGRLLAVNPAFAALFGYDSPEELLAAVTDIARQLYVDPERRETFIRTLETKGEIHGFEAQLYRKDGAVIWERVTARAVRDEGGSTLHYEGSIEDITDRVQAEAHLREREAEYRLLFESNPHPMWVFDDETLVFLAVNEAAVRHYGYSREEFLGMTIEGIRPREEVPLLAKHLAARDRPEAERSVHKGVWTHRRKDGSLIRVRVSAGTIVFQGRKARLVLATDLTEREQLEAQLRQAQKMEAVGRLAGGVAHDFNNLLTTILGYSELLIQQRHEDAELVRELEEIRAAGERAAALTRQLLAFSRRQVLQPKVLDLNAVVTDFERMLRRLIGEDVELASRLDPRLGRVEADPGQLEQVIMNLAVNARDAMPQGGKLTIETANVELSEAYAAERADVDPGPYVLLAISDTGTGMDEQTKSRLFEPFFTTKEAGKGTGLGLATAYGIVKQSGGHIAVYSELGRGTTFKVYLPRIEAAVERSSEIETGPLPRGSETVLLVEDEVGVRALVRTLLEAQGYAVLEASGAEEALEIAGSHARPIDLILTDVVMPGSSGPGLRGELERSRPGTRFLFMSGYTDDAVVRHGALESGLAFLQKPFTPEALARKVREVLDRPSG